MPPSTPWRSRTVSAASLTALGIDVGSTNTKVAIVAIPTADVLAVRSFPTPGSASRLQESVETFARELVAMHGAPAVVGIASMAETGVPLDADDVPLTDFVRWNRRTERGRADDVDLTGLTARLGSAALFTATGVPATPKTPMVAWRRLSRMSPAIWHRMSRWAGAADVVGLALTGTLVTDHTLAGRTMAYRLPDPGSTLPPEFDTDLLAEVGLDPSRLPAIALPDDHAATVTRSASARTGLTPGTPVIVAGHDHAVGAWAAGAREPGDIADSIGTAEALIRIAGGAIDRSRAAATGMSIVRSVSGRHEALLAGSPAAGALIALWFDEVIAPAQPAIVFGEVAASLPTESGILVLPYPFGRQTPLPDPGRRLEILERDGHPLDRSAMSPSESTLGLLEGLSLQLRWMSEEQDRLLGVAAADTIVRVLGGAAGGNEAWLRVKAAVLPHPLERVTVAEPVASGAALLAAVRVGLANPDSALPREPVQRTGTCDHDAMFEDFVAAATRPATTTAALSSTHAPTPGGS